MLLTEAMMGSRSILAIRLALISEDATGWKRGPHEYLSSQTKQTTSVRSSSSITSKHTAA
jgi:hypothetical protein